MENEETFRRIIALVEKHGGTSKKEIYLNSKLQKDLGFDGVEGEEFMVEYCKMFSIDTTLYEFSDYFYGEGLDILGALKSLFKKNKYHEIQISHLVNCAINKKWIIPS